MLRVVLDAGLPHRRGAHEANDVGHHRLLADLRGFQVDLAFADDRGGIDAVAGSLGDRHRLAGEQLLVYRRLALDDDAVDRDQLAWINDDLVALADLLHPDPDLLPSADDPRVLDVGREEALDRPPGLMKGEVPDDVAEGHEPHHHAGRTDPPLESQDGGGGGVQRVDVEAALLGDRLDGSPEDRDGGSREQPGGQRRPEQYVGGDRGLLFAS